MPYILSKHADQQAAERRITLEIIDQIMSSPQQVIDEIEFGQKIYQSIITFSENKTYLVRICVNVEKEPNVVKTVYRTSKIAKYYEGEI